MWICKELLSNQTVGSHRSFYCGTNMCYLSMDPHANTIWYLLLCFLPVYTFVGCYVCWCGSALGIEHVPGEEAVECPSRLGLLQAPFGVSNFALQALLLGIEFLQTTVLPQEKHLLPKWRVYLLFLSKHPSLCGSTALHSRSCCHYTSSTRLLSIFWCFSPHFFSCLVD